MAKFIITKFDRLIDLVSILAIVLLIAVLTGIGIMMKTTKSDKVFPEFSNDCPDAWALNADGTQCNPTGVDNIPINKGYLTRVQPPRGAVTIDANNKVTAINVKNESYVGWELCKKKAWANAMDFTWSGVSNTNQC